MIKKLTANILKTPMLLAILVVIATGCHTPEDLEDIGPQKPDIIEPAFIKAPSAGPDKSTTVGNKNTILSRSEENTVEVFGRGVIVIKTPFKPSLKIPKPKCKTC